MDELDISGKRYISTRRAGREHGYHSDYIGQLIRGGKVQGQKVGRSWYVDEESLAVYLGKAYAAPAPVEAIDQVAPAAASPIVEEIKKDPEPVVEKEIAPVKSVIENVEPQPVIEEKEEVVEQKKGAPEKEEAHEVTLKIRTQEEIPEEKAASPSGLRYITDSEPLLPHIEREHRSEVTRVNLIPTKAPQKRKRRFALPALAFAAAALIAGSAWAAATLSSTTQVEGTTASVYYSFGR